MFVQAIAEIFKYNAVGSIIVLACWAPQDQVTFSRELSKLFLLTSFSCDPGPLEHVNRHRLQGILYIPPQKHVNYKVKPEYFSNWYKWVVLDDSVPSFFKSSRYDADILLIHQRTDISSVSNVNTSQEMNATEKELVYIHDVYTHPRDGFTLHPWAIWTSRKGLQILFEREKILRRQNLKYYPLKIATPLGMYSKEWFNGTFLEYLMDMSMAERDSGVRCGYMSSVLIIEMLNASEVMVPTKLWSTEVNNSSMMVELRYGSSDLGGGVLRMMPERFDKVDYAMSIWPFHVGFTYLAERESSSNMFIEPFTVSVWWCCLSLFIILALTQRMTAKKLVEKEGALIGALATYLQQDASAVPNGISGRWSFLVVSISAMLIHAYYTSAIVSSLMSAGRAGPDSLRALGDSKYAIASEDYTYMRYLMFDVQTNWDELEYLKRKKLTPKFYQTIHTGVQMILAGQTAYHTEYNQIYPLFKTFTDDQVCKLQYVDTVPEVRAWVTTTKHGQWTPTFRIAGAWLHETGLAKRLVTRLRMKPPPCRAALLAERVNVDDIFPLLMLTIAGAITSLILMGIETLISKWRQRMIK